MCRCWRRVTHATLLRLALLKINLFMFSQILCHACSVVDSASRMGPVPSRSRRSDALLVTGVDNVETNVPSRTLHHVKNTRNFVFMETKSVRSVRCVNTVAELHVRGGWLVPAPDEHSSMPEQSALAESPKCRLAPRAEEGTTRQHLDPRDADRGERGCNRCHTARMDSPWSPTKDTIILSSSAQVQWIFLLGYRGDESAQSDGI